MKLLNGRKIAEKLLKDLTLKVKKAHKKASLAVILVGEDRASEVYVGLKEKTAMKVGIGFKLYKFKNTAGEKMIIDLIQRLNADFKTSGIIVQLPLPKKYHTQKIINAIDLRKDADGFLKKSSHLQPVFPQAIMKLIESSKQKISGEKGIIIANSKIFGETMKETLEGKKVKAEYILTRNISENKDKIKQADILVSAVGKKGIIKGNILKKGSIIIDGGIIKKGKKVFGDVDFDSVKNIAGFITPVPGGVGPVTIACLLQNVYLAAKNQK